MKTKFVILASNKTREGIQEAVQKYFFGYKSFRREGKITRILKLSGKPLDEYIKETPKGFYFGFDEEVPQA